ncbi:hypothetical protein D5086_014246 [Populus alba]|uniref:Uncharacterized protein n=1 Tax=Populus alba TaxID=43335 RepID=A0ACC4BXR4_POPAL
MDKQSVHGFDSNESDLDLQGEAYECERIEDELQDNLDFCVDEDDKTSVQCIELAVNAEGLEPCVGMEFNSRDEAREFYISYGRCTGFTDEKDKRIRELSLELYNERQKCKRRCAVYEEQLNMILQDLEKHTEHVSKKVDDVVKSIREIEEEHSDDSNSE